MSDDQDIPESQGPSGEFQRVDIVDEMKTSYLDYAMSVIVARALPDVRDGLKPVHRRILFSMSENGYTHDKPHRRCSEPQPLGSLPCSLKLLHVRRHWRRSIR